MAPLVARRPAVQPAPTASRSATHADAPGDRAAACASAMEPIAVTVRADGEWALVHRCAGCSAVRVNRIAGDDNPLALMRLAVRPLARPPFPLETLGQL
jgi:hypothetical protein